MLTCILLAAVFAAASARTPWYDTYDDPQTLPDRTVMVHLFEWKWTDIAKECEDFLSVYGYGAVQVSPPMEHITLNKNGDLPWWVRYQPVSYKLNSRSGSPTEFADMVKRCNKVGVRIIVDGVLNHMVAVGQKKGANGIGSSGDCDFDGMDGVENFPCVSYTKDNFNDYKCHGDINGGDYTGNAERVRNCRLVGLLDLDQSQEYVKRKMIEYLNMLIDLGVAGFRLDASKHMHHADLKDIIHRIKNLSSDIFGENQRPFIVHEVIDKGGEAIKSQEYIDIGRYTDFNYGLVLTQAARRQNKGFGDMEWWGPGYGYGNLDDTDVLAFIDNHDNQRDGGSVLTYKNGNQYSMTVAFMLAWVYGYPRVMSGYAFSYSDQGPPSNGQSSGWAVIIFASVFFAALHETQSPTFNPDKTCMNISGWVCEHRWNPIRGMVRWRNEAANADIDHVYSEQNRLAFGKVGKGYFVLNNGDNNWTYKAKTSLPAGAYCDVWSGELQNGQCTGQIVNVAADGSATFTVPKSQFMAIHTGWKL